MQNNLGVLIMCHISVIYLVAHAFFSPHFCPRSCAAAHVQLTAFQHLTGTAVQKFDLNENISPDLGSSIQVWWWPISQ